jgi:hypothetical protein
MTKEKYIAMKKAIKAYELKNEITTYNHSTMHCAVCGCKEFWEDIEEEEEEEEDNDEVEW